MTEFAPDLKQKRALALIKLLHTVVWAFLAGCILAIPVVAAKNHFTAAFVLIGMVSVECIVLAMNGIRCPLTDLAGRYTEERVENFDIYLPLWLARHNKSIFGTLFAAGTVYVLVKWLILQGKFF